MTPDIQSRLTPAFVDSSDMRALVEAYDWSVNPLGPRDRWPQSLRTAVDIVLDSPLAMIVLWGPDLIQIYNDAYGVIAGVRHPQALGQPTRDCWPEVWDFNAPVYAAVMAGEAHSFPGQKLVIERNAMPTEAWFDLNYSPLRDETGNTSGVLVTVVETTDRTLADRRIVAHINRQRQLFDHAPGFVSISHGPDHVFEFVNAAYIRLCGERDYIGQTVRDVFPDISDQGYYKNLDRVYETGERFVARELPLRMDPTDGAASIKQRFVDFIYEPVIDEEGNVTGIFTQGHDVTEAYLARRQERHADAEFLRHVLASSNDCLKVLDLDGKLTFMNEGGKNLMEVSDFSVIDGCTWVDVWEGQAKIDATAAIALAKGGQNARFQGAANTMAGTPKWWDIQITPMLGSDGKPERLLWVSRDITDQKHAELALRGKNVQLEREALQRTIERDRVWVNSRDILVIGDLDGTFRAANPAWTDILGYDEGETLGRNFREFVWHEDSEMTKIAVEATRRGEPLNRFENRYRHKDGTSRWLSWQTSFEDGAIYGYARNITQEKERAEELLAVEAQLRQAQKMEAVGQLTGGIAHDFNNMLQGVLGGLEVIQLRLEAKRYDDIDMFIDGARQSGERAAALTKRLLAFSRSQSLKVEALDATALTQGMTVLLQQTLGEHVELKMVLQPDLWAVQADGSQLENALLNLAINARDAMPDGGRLTIEATNVVVSETDTDRSRNLAFGDYIAICVSDTGTGMSQNVVNRAFDPFFTTKLIGEGTGLGLSMIFGFAKQSHGHVAIESEVGQGTTVTLYLPRATDAVAPKPDIVAPASSVARLGENILVVDDEDMVRLVMTDALGDLGYDFEQAIDGDTALAILRSDRKIDLMITDVGLPGINGRQLSEMARRLRPDLKVLFVTGYAAAAGVQGGLSDGTDLLTKPFALDSFGAKVRLMLDDTVKVEEHQES